MEWEYSSLSHSLIDTKSRDWGKNTLLTTLLLNRGITTKEEAQRFIEPNVKNFRNPFDFEKMEEVVAKILEKKEKGEKIFIYGDYDVDGITATVFLVKVFSEIGIDTDYYIPNRMEEGYGLDKKAIDFIKKENGSLIITVDTGVNSTEDIEYALKNDIDIIVTDHHRSIKEYENILVLNPKLSETYKFKYLSGAGVALKVAQGVFKKLGLKEKILYKYMDIVMIGTVADVVPMLDENRIIIKEGLKVLKNTSVKGMKYLLKYLKFQDKDMTTTDVSYYISPLINSLGRIGISKTGADFFLKNDEFEIYNIIEEMKKTNKRRRELEKKIYDEANEQILKNIDRKCVFLYSEKWHPGVIGVVSSRLTNRYNVPVALIAIRGNIGKASCRSIEGVSVFNIFQLMKDRLIRFGGHDLAAGFIVEKENIEEVGEIFEKNITIIQSKSKEKKIKIDMEFPLENVNEEVLDTIEILSPFGLENSQPLFMEKNLTFESIKKFGVNDRHFNGIIRKNNKTYSMVAFDLGDKIDEDAGRLQKFDIIYYPEKTFFKGEEIIQIRIKDLKIKDDFYEIFIK